MIRITAAAIALAFTLGITASAIAQTKNYNASRSNKKSAIAQNCPKDQAYSAKLKKCEPKKQKKPAAAATGN